MEINQSNLLRVANALKRNTLSLKNLKKLVFWAEAESYCANFSDHFSDEGQLPRPITSPLEKYFENHQEGHGIWKWIHYFDIYHRHLNKFIGQEVNILEVGIYSGGSFGMWRDYFGPRCRIFGVDIEPACKCYEDEQTKVFIGDQEDRGFWRRVKKELPPVDIIIDDGGHMPNQQKVTLEETLPHIKPGGVYICEDIHGDDNSFSAYATGYVRSLNKFDLEKLSHFQTAIHSIHFYPFITVIEKYARRPEKFVSSKRGTLWQPFFKEGA